MLARNSARRDLALLGAAALTFTANFASAETPTCRVDGYDWRVDPIHETWAAGEGRDVEFHDGIGSCKVTETHDFSHDGRAYRVTVAELFGKRDGPPILAPRASIRLVSFFRIAEGRTTEIGRAVLDRDPFDTYARFEPQTTQVGDRVVVRLMRRAPNLFIIAGDAVSTTPAFGWRDEAARVLGPGDALGQSWSVDLSAMRGHLAVHRAHDPARLPGAHTAARLIVAELVWRDDTLALSGARLAEGAERPRPDDTAIDTIERQDASVFENARDRGVPPGAEACELTAWSIDDGTRGLAVRASPSPQARVLGVVPPPRRAGGEVHRATFDVVGYRDGWFLVAGVKRPGDGQLGAPPAGTPRAYGGRGWVEATKVRAGIGNSGLPPNRVYASPHADATWTRATRLDGRGLTHGDAPARLLACSGVWGLVETRAGQRGWTRAMCATRSEPCD